MSFCVFLFIFSRLFNNLSYLNNLMCVVINSYSNSSGIISLWINDIEHLLYPSHWAKLWRYSVEYDIHGACPQE